MENGETRAIHPLIGTKDKSPSLAGAFVLPVPELGSLAYLEPRRDLPAEQIDFLVHVLVADAGLYTSVRAGCLVIHAKIASRFGVDAELVKRIGMLAMMELSWQPSSQLSPADPFQHPGQHFPGHQYLRKLKHEPSGTMESAARGCQSAACCLVVSVELLHIIL